MIGAWSPIGDGALRMARPREIDARALLDLFRAWPRVTDAVVTEEHVAIYFDPRAVPADPTEALARLRDPPSSSRWSRVTSVKARYDGPDLAEVAASLELSVEALVSLHAAGDYEVAMIGFLPGFAYLNGVDARLFTPRRATPRPRVAAGSIGLAGRHTGIYPFASPAGWNLIATAVGFQPFTTERGATLGLGHRVRFERVD